MRSIAQPVAAYAGESQNAEQSRLSVPAACGGAGLYLCLQSWPLLQLLKLGVAQGLPQLTDYYVIWDFDMLPTRRIPLFYQPVHANGVNVQAEQQPRMVVNIGGARSYGYEAAYKTLFGQKCATHCSHAGLLRLDIQFNAIHLLSLSL
jgi:hypothetical protein